ncbi:alpha/beta hydrolase [Flavobacterium sp. Fl-77]|uniref:Alpha/beta hydrolase n=1 Tax=Flavobacterium flavipigmentatum TaxID=2893884 RepID=A0AAJ2SGH9_9FLAO|nr:MULTISPECIES: alpha/beta hydrolase [unclassified Flavobacterium]MDX6182439.1 alpha/beta hydrolase [Flavobacterium sp. Fl-33]MDX6185648.1 alpha/beta hydrolase [Flavobacterium sp. Fl-77]UFH38833.1 alpha/beta hydrolase [Flavobacterium sp. F-70]
MKPINLKQQLNPCYLFALFIFSFLLVNTTSIAQTGTKSVKNIVLVHGAFADGSGWKALYESLSKKGYNVTIVQNTLTSLEDDVAATNVVLDKQTGPTILVGHSWGGAVITEAGNHKNVVALVYIAAFQPDNGETALQWFQTVPPSPENGVLAPDAKGIVYYDQAKYHAGFCADISKEEAAFMFASQGAFYGKGFATPIIKASWRDKPTYAVVATNDKSIAPQIQRMMYKRSNTKITEIKGSHVVFMSQPEGVAKVIVTASKNTIVQK